MSKQQAEAKTWLLDHEVEAATAGAITKRRLQRDRYGQQFFPFHRVGRTVYYSLDEINATIERARSGGKVAA